MSKFDNNLQFSKRENGSHRFFLEEQKKRKAIKQYLRGYLEQPETQIEEEGMLQIATKTLKQEDWT